MASEETAFCTQCGAAISRSARFCRACGAHRNQLEGVAAADSTAVVVQPATATGAPPPSSLAPPPVSSASPLPPITAVPRRDGPGTAPFGAAILAVSGGLGMLLIAVSAIVYYPLHYHYSLNYGVSLQFGDLLALGSALVAIVVCARALRRPPSSKVNGILLIAAGSPTFVLAFLWAYPETFHLTTYPPPFYTGFLYFIPFGRAHIGSGHLSVPLAVASVAVVLGGILMQIGSAGSMQRAS